MACTGQPCLVHFVDQGAVADAKRLSGSLEVPVVLFEGLQDHLPFDIRHGSPGHVLQEGLAGRSRSWHGGGFFVTTQFAEDWLLGTEDDITANKVLKFTDVPRPTIMVHSLD